MNHYDTNAATLPTGWKWVKLGDLFKTTSGGTPSRKMSQYYNGQICWVKSGELNQNIILDTEEKISQAALEHSSAKLFPKGTLLIALYGATIGKLAFLGVEAATNQAVCGIFKNEQTNIHYLYFFLQFKKTDLIRLGAGGAQPNISQDIVRKIDLPLPPLPIQSKIVAQLESLLSELDNGTKQLRTAQAQLKTYRQAVLKAAFEGKFTGGTNNWQKCTLGDLKTYSLYGPRFSKTDYADTGIAVLRTTDISDWGKVDYAAAPKIKLSQSDLQKYRILKNDLLITRTGSIGRVSLFNDEIDAIPGAYLIQYRLNQHIYPKFAFYFLKSPTIQAEMTAKSAGIGRLNLNVPSISDFAIHLPPLDIQQKIVDEIETRLSICDALEATLKTSLAQSETLRQSLLKQAFEGKLVS